MEDSKQHLRHLPKIKKGHFCLNCGETLEDDDNFCRTCGQLNDTRRITFDNIVRETLSDIFAYDSRFLNSLIPLFTKPGQVTTEYIKGKRTFHIHPIRLYFIVSFIFFFFSAINSHFGEDKNDVPIKVHQDNVVDLRDKDIVTFSPGQIKERDNLIYQVFRINEKSVVDSALVSMANKQSWALIRLILIEGFDSDGQVDDSVFEKYQIEKSLWNKFIKNRAISAAKFRTETFWENFKSNFPLFALFFLPIFAGFINLLFYKIDILYYEHLMFVFHMQSMFFIVQTFDNIFDFIIPSISGIVALIVFSWFFVYLFKALANFYLLKKMSQKILAFIAYISGYMIIALILFLVFLFSYFVVYSLLLE